MLGPDVAPSLDGLTALQSTWAASEPDVATRRSTGASELQTLDVSYCDALTSLPALDGLTALKNLYLYGCSGLTSLPPLDGRRRCRRST